MSYSWGSDTSTGWSGGYDYDSARGGYSKTPSTRTYTGGTGTASVGTKSKSVVAAAKYPLEQLATESTQPLVVAVDVTGSMADWPALIFEKLPLLYNEVVRYLPDVEISFAAIGDAYSDKHPVQVTAFGKGVDLDAKVNSLYPEGGGGGGARESYELTAHYFLTQCDMQKAKKPIFIFAGDEGFYESVAKDVLSRYFTGEQPASLDGMKAMRDLGKKFDTYILRKPYGSGYDNSIAQQWKNVLGDQKVMKLDDPRRIVDCIIGIVAASAGGFMDFTKRLSERQEDDKVKSVMKTLRSIATPGDPSKAISTKTPASSKASKKLVP